MIGSLIKEKLLTFYFGRCVKNDEYPYKNETGYKTVIFEKKYGVKIKDFSTIEEIEKFIEKKKAEN